MLPYKEYWLQTVDILQRECVELMSIGLSYDDYWYGELDKANMFISAYEKRRENELQECNIKAFLQGQYNCFAIGCNLSEKIKYPSEPFNLSGKKKITERDSQQSIENEMLAYLSKKQGDLSNG